jgi:hypothetical protein
MAKRRESKAEVFRRYDPTAIVDAPEHYEYGRAMGILTWGTWDHDASFAPEKS